MSLKQKGFITVAALFSLVLAMPFASTLWIRGTAVKDIYQSTTEAPAAEVAVVLGAAVYNPHSLSPILEDRMDAAIELFQGKQIPMILLSGEANEVEAMDNYAREKGMPASAILKDPGGYNTLATIQNIPRQFKEIILVSQSFHLPRALFYARHEGFKASGVAADRREYAKIFEFKKRELLANVKAFFDVFVTPEFNPLTRRFD